MCRAADDTETTNQLAETHFDYAREVAAHLAGKHTLDRDDCESAAMEVLVTASRKYDAGKGEFKPYLQRLIRNRILSEGRRHKTAADFAPAVAAHETQRRDTNTPGNFDELINEVEDPTDREIIRRHYQGNDSFFTIAADLGLNLVEVSRRHTGALATLRRKLGAAA